VYFVVGVFVRFRAPLQLFCVTTGFSVNGQLNLKEI
jgi:hypothetical protein